MEEKGGFVMMIELAQVFAYMILNSGFVMVLTGLQTLTLPPDQINEKI